MGLARWIVGAVGVWTLALAFLASGHRIVAWSDLLGGMAVLVAGTFLLHRRHRIRGGLAMFLGAWLATGSVLFQLHVGDGLVSNHVIVGLAIALVGFGPYGRG
jgi:hypothetical protein